MGLETGDERERGAHIELAVAALTVLRRLHNPVVGCMIVGLEEAAGGGMRAEFEDDDPTARAVAEGVLTRLKGMGGDGGEGGSR